MGQGSPGGSGITVGQGFLWDKEEQETLSFPLGQEVPGEGRGFWGSLWVSKKDKELWPLGVPGGGKGQ